MRKRLFVPGALVGLAALLVTAIIALSNYGAATPDSEETIAAAPTASAIQASEVVVRTDPYPGWPHPNQYQPHFFATLTLTNRSSVPWKIERGPVRFDQGFAAGAVFRYWSRRLRAFTEKTAETAGEFKFEEWKPVTCDSDGRPHLQPVTVAPGETAQVKVWVGNGDEVWGDGVKRLPVALTVALPAAADIGAPGAYQEFDPARLVTLSLSPAKQ